MESEADRRANVQERRRARKRVTREKRRKLRLQAALESVSEVGIPQKESSRESNYFVDCRKKCGLVVDEAGCKAVQLWKLRKELGISVRSGEREITEKLLEMERRDREAGSVQAGETVVDGELGSESRRLDEDTIV